MSSQDLQPGRYNGPAFAAEAIDRSFTSHKDQVLILDVAAGTGLVGEQVCNYIAFIHVHSYLFLTSNYLLIFMQFDLEMIIEIYINHLKMSKRNV